MKAVVWHGKRDVRVDEVADPRIEAPTDIIVQVTSSGICGSDLHLYEVMVPAVEEGDVMGHEPMGVVTDAGAEVEHVAPGDRVVVPFKSACGHCVMCERGLQSQCERGGIDRVSALFDCFEAVCRGGTVSISGVYGGLLTPIPMMALFDKQVAIRIGQAIGTRRIPEILPLLTDDEDPLGTEEFASHRLALDDAPQAYERFQRKQDGTSKVLLRP